jgi:hypothetical protein
MRADETGTHLSPGVALGHSACRSSICHWPAAAYNEDRSVVVV